VYERPSYVRGVYRNALQVSVPKIHFTQLRYCQERLHLSADLKDGPLMLAAYDGQYTTCVCAYGYGYIGSVRFCVRNRPVGGGV
jgi:hypothetical protein